MTKLIYGVLLGLGLALPSTGNEKLPQSDSDTAPTTQSATPEPVTTTGGQISGVDDPYLYGDWVDESTTPREVDLWLGRLVADNAERLACILQASLDGDGRPFRDLEAGGFIGGSSSTIMVHDGIDHPIAHGTAPQRIPHVHVWPPPRGAIAWVHTHHPNRGLNPSTNDLQAAAMMQQNHGVNLPFLVLTPNSVTAYWHGHTMGGITIAGDGWWDGHRPDGCATVYGQQAPSPR